MGEPPGVQMLYLFFSAKGGPSKQFFNMTHQFSKLNPITKLKLSVKRSATEAAEQKEEGPKNPLTSALLSPLLPPRRGGSATSLSKLPSATLNRQLSRSTDDLHLSPSPSASNPAEFLSESLNAMAQEAEEDAAIVAQVIVFVANQLVYINITIVIHDHESSLAS